ncbi:hypothetical protein BDZ45DRAFT_798312 [Acephala macrosclerotiorum]|nr:hypothetical protein BDZ45DRAFT_798312 [Acephala macrosclerotiorum]
MEGVGIVLAVLPLIVSALEHYEDVFVPFQRYKDYVPELGRFQRRLLAQKTIFRSQCQLLLVSLTDEDTARSMLEEGHHQEWLSNDLEARLSEQLGDSTTACVATIKEIQTQLSSIEEEAENTNVRIANEGHPTTMPSDNSSRTRIKTKLKFAMSKSRLQDYIDRLRDSNQDFIALSDQTKKILAATGDNRPSTSSAIAIKQCDMIQKDSVQLYEALAVACSLHKAHQAHLQIGSPPLNQTSSLQPPSVDFRVGLSKVVNEENPAPEIPVWLLIKPASGHVSSLQHNDNFQLHRSAQVSLLHQTLMKREAKPEAQPDCSRQRKRLKKKDGRPKQRQDSTANLAAISSTNPTTSSSLADPTGPRNIIALRSIPEVEPTRNFCTAQDLCIHIRAMSTQSSIVQETCFGCLKRSSTTYKLYYENQTKFPNQSINLDDLISEMGKRDRNKQPLPSLSLVESIKVARNVALFVLRFHATPLLNPSWGARNVTFFGLSRDCIQDGEGHQLSPVKQLPAPFLNMNVQVTSSSLRAATDIQSTNFPDARIRNQDLFRLGVILLELAYQAPLGNIRADSPRGNTQTDFDLADKHSRNVGALLGSRYAKVVRKCLNCDFGQDNDLSAPELKKAVHKGVVIELEDLVKNFETKMSVN